MMQHTSNLTQNRKNCKCCHFVTDFVTLAISPSNLFSGVWTNMQAAPILFLLFWCLRIACYSNLKQTFTLNRGKRPHENGSLNLNQWRNRKILFPMPNAWTALGLSYMSGDLLKLAKWGNTFAILQFKSMRKMEEEVFLILPWMGQFRGAISGRYEEVEFLFQKRSSY